MSSFKFDFAHWSSLAKSDPAAFELQRSEVINDLLDNLNSHKEQRLRCMQWRLDKIRELAKTPLAACIEMSELMWNNVMGEGGLLDVLEGYRRGHLLKPATPRDLAGSATILPFSPRQR